MFIQHALFFSISIRAFNLKQCCQHFKAKFNCVKWWSLDFISKNGRTFEACKKDWGLKTRVNSYANYICFFSSSK
jgi:hypothetical protein